MRALLQRVSQAEVKVEGEVIASIGPGLLIFLGVAQGDCSSDADWLAEKAAGLRIFSDAEGKMNLAVTDLGGSVLVVSQFILYADCRRGRRPSFEPAAKPTEAEALYQYFMEKLGQLGLKVSAGRFGADMKVTLLNDGPVTVLLDSPAK